MAPKRTVRESAAGPRIRAPARPPEDDVAPPRRRRQGPVNIGSLTGRLTRPALGKRGFAGAEILAHWPTIVGAELAAFACPLQVKYPRGRNAGATLHLRVAHGAAAAMLHMKLPSIITRINRFFGYDAVDQVQAAQGPMPVREATRESAAEPLPAEAGAEVEAQIAGIASEPVKAALAKLGIALQHRSRTRR